MSFKTEHDKWMNDHLARRQGERRDALSRGHGFGNRLFLEKIWWPLQGHFNGLHPEYEVKDWRGRSFFVDFMWVIKGNYVAIEIMDYGSHGTDRTKYRMDINRALFLQTQGYRYVEIALDEIKENHLLVINMLKMIFAPYLAVEESDAFIRKYSKTERLLMQFAIKNERVIRPSQAAKELELHIHTVIKYCQSLIKKGKLRAIPSGSSGRIHKYEYLGAMNGFELLT